MKSIKGLLLIFGLSVLALASTESDSNSPKIKDNIFTAIRSIDYTSINVQFHAVEMLISRGADHSIQNTDGNTAITLASKFGHNKIVTFFQEKRTIRSYTK